MLLHSARTAAIPNSYQPFLALPSIRGLVHNKGRVTSSTARTSALGGVVLG